MAPNLYKHSLHKATWIAHDADGFAFRVRKVAGRYLAVPSYAASATDGRRFTRRKLSEVAASVGSSHRKES